MADNEALQDTEQGDDVLDQGDFSQPASQGALPPSGGAQVSPSAQSAPTGQLPGGGVASTNDDDSYAPSNKAMFLGKLLKSVLSGIQNSPGNPNNAFDRGFMGAFPNAQQAQKAKQDQAAATLQHTLSENDLMKQQVALTGMKALQTEYMLKRLPQEDQMKHLDVVSKFKDNLIKQGASIEAEADDEKAGDEQALRMNGTDPRSTQHEGKFYSLPTIDSDGKAKFDVVYVPTKDTLQEDYTYEDSDGKEHTIPAGTPMAGAMGKFVENLQKNVQSDTKEQHRQMGDALKPNVPDGEIPQTIAWLKNQQKQNTPLYQQNKNSVDAQINTLNAAHGQIQSDKLAAARAGVQMRADEKTKQDDKAGEDALNYATNYLKESPTGPGDEALMEKFFELAKPSKGFRMSQPQIDMLKNARSWMDSAEAKTRHATSGTWFSDTQRQQIAHTMSDLAKSKGGASMPDLGKPVYVGGKLVGHTKDGKTMTPVQ